MGPTTLTTAPPQFLDLFFFFFLSIPASPLLTEVWPRKEIHAVFPQIYIFTFSAQFNSYEVFEVFSFLFIISYHLAQLHFAEV